MTSNLNDEDTSVKVEIIPQSSQVSSQTNDLVETEMAGESDDLKSETKALIDALKKRAQVEAQNAGTLTREAYLTAVRRAREKIENEQLIERDRIENSFELIKNEAEKNWESVIKEREFGLSGKQQVVVDRNRRLLRLVTIGNQPAQNVDKAIDRRTMP